MRILRLCRCWPTGPDPERMEQIRLSVCYIIEKAISYQIYRNKFSGVSLESDLEKAVKFSKETGIQASNVSDESKCNRPEDNVRFCWFWCHSKCCASDEEIKTVSLSIGWIIQTTWGFLRTYKIESLEIRLTVWHIRKSQAKSNRISFWKSTSYLWLDQTQSLQSEAPINAKLILYRKQYMIVICCIIKERLWYPVFFFYTNPS